MRTTASQYVKDTRYDARGVQLLSMAVIERAFLDYLDALKLLACIRDPYRSKNTFRRYTSVFQHCAKVVRDRCRRFKKIGKYKGSPEVTYNQILEVITSYYYVIATRLLDNKEFLLGDRMKLFSERISGEDIIEKAEAMAEDWADGRVPYKIVNVGVWK